MSRGPPPVIVLRYTPALVVHEAKVALRSSITLFGERLPEIQRGRVFAVLIGGQTIVKRIGMDHHTVRQYQNVAESALMGIKMADWWF